MVRGRQNPEPTNNDILGADLIESAVRIENALAGLVEAETAKVNVALEIVNGVAGIESINALANLDNSVANVLGQICGIEGEINGRIQAGITLRGF